MMRRGRERLDLPWLSLVRALVSLTLVTSTNVGLDILLQGGPPKRTFQRGEGLLASKMSTKRVIVMKAEENGIEVRGIWDPQLATCQVENEVVA